MSRTLKVPLLETTHSESDSIKQRRQSKYKPPESMAVTLSKGLEFAPLARVLVNSNIYFLFIFGLVAILMAQDRSSSMAFTTAPGIYCIVLAIFIYIGHFVGEFTKQDKSVDSILRPRGWPQVVCITLSTFNLNPVQCVFCIM
ncbi:predicted protein [Naegleria gruberi]|uniref:Predicted protein n=1 Tax=Naegleria gruberi TaxID=5762 RepID=D2VCC6_NAEGR|nr:uncharacterized protein NAEGRDRAFT_66524 [Naegleria gruberi]EFC45728.1 predicted protein [Naegleria gruberi]|eukprot:XP_002678472.1 predicted protein [Naegleria gruberi strain NEG-M]